MTTMNPPAQSKVKPSGQKVGRIDLKRIVVPIDFSIGADEATEFAIDLAAKYDGALTLLHVLELTHDMRYMVTYPDFVALPLDIAELEASSRKEAEQKMISLCAQIDNRGVAARQVVCVGFAATEIIRLAEEEKADCIVISTHGYSGLTHFLLGSTAERVIRHATCPVMVVRMKDNKSKS